MMNMDRMVDKPENHGLRPGWSEAMQGMMTILRVFPPKQYDAMVERIRQERQQGMPDMPGMDHSGHGA